MMDLQIKSHDQMSQNGKKANGVFDFNGDIQVVLDEQQIDEKTLDYISKLEYLINRSKQKMLHEQKLYSNIIQNLAYYFDNKDIKSDFVEQYLKKLAHMDDDDDENEQVSDKLDIFEDLMLNYVPKLNTVEEIKQQAIKPLEKKPQQITQASTKMISRVPIQQIKPKQQSKGKNIIKISLPPQQKNINIEDIQSPLLDYDKPIVVDKQQFIKEVKEKKVKKDIEPKKQKKVKLDVNGQPFPAKVPKKKLTIEEKNLEKQMNSNSKIPKAFNSFQNPFQNLNMDNFQGTNFNEVFSNNSLFMNQQKQPQSQLKPMDQFQNQQSGLLDQLNKINPLPPLNLDFSNKDFLSLINQQNFQTNLMNFFNFLPPFNPSDSMNLMQQNSAINDQSILDHYQNLLKQQNIEPQRKTELVQKNLQQQYPQQQLNQKQNMQLPNKLPPQSPINNQSLQNQSFQLKKSP